jgi:deazaflavin-dependent oxidoreductase (nitroreductase family)
MSLDTPAGTRGARMPGASSPIAKFVSRLMGRQHRRAGYKFQGMDVLFLTTTGRKSGQPHENPVSWFADGDDAWLIVAAGAGSAKNPAWYLNMGARPDQVWIELPDRKVQVTPEQLAGERREEAWRRITTAQPRFAKYQTKTDRTLPVIRLVPAGTAAGVADGTTTGTADTTTGTADATTDGTTAGTTDTTTAGTADTTTAGTVGATAGAPTGTTDGTAAGTAGATTDATTTGTTGGTTDTTTTTTGTAGGTADTTAGTTGATTAGTADAGPAGTADGSQLPPDAGTTDGAQPPLDTGTTDGSRLPPDAP